MNVDTHPYPYRETGKENKDDMDMTLASTTTTTSKLSREEQLRLWKQSKGTTTTTTHQNGPTTRSMAKTALRKSDPNVHRKNETLSKFKKPIKKEAWRRRKEDDLDERGEIDKGNGKENNSEMKTHPPAAAAAAAMSVRGILDAVDSTPLGDKLSTLKSTSTTSTTGTVHKKHSQAHTIALLQRELASKSDDIQSLQKRLSAATARASRAESEVALREDDFVTVRAEVRELRDLVQELREECVQKDKKIEALEVALIRKDTELDEVKQTIGHPTDANAEETRDRQAFESLCAELAAKEDLVSQLEHTLVERNLEIEELCQVVETYESKDAEAASRRADQELEQKYLAALEECEELKTVLVANEVKIMQTEQAIREERKRGDEVRKALDDVMGENEKLWNALRADHDAGAPSPSRIPVSPIAHVSPAPHDHDDTLFHAAETRIHSDMNMSGIEGDENGSVNEMSMDLGYAENDTPTTRDDEASASAGAVAGFKFFGADQ
ncbi:hypothetical protein BC832DRAFT_555724 [Gaertneriomyces semiglobifer]|nr:hypothetical protein BC832DRAFT_555724 [Gaertneriomyces semiglobifer]